MVFNSERRPGFIRSVPSNLGVLGFGESETAVDDDSAMGGRRVLLRRALVGTSSCMAL